MQEAERLVVAADEDVLAVVDAFSGLGIDERGRPASETWPCLEDQHTRTALGERHCGRETSESRGGGRQMQDFAAINRHRLN